MDGGRQRWEEPCDNLDACCRDHNHCIRKKGTEPTPPLTIDKISSRGCSDVAREFQTVAAIDLLCSAILLTDGNASAVWLPVLCSSCSTTDLLLGDQLCALR
ncbi:hypothetical protein ZWY2020_037587 [Hordeum vulgare]|nr:hypothetical protein ZWY2020_037587 [Hordeum vulgare]